MATSFERYQKKRLITSYFSFILILATTLYILGLLGSILLYSDSVSRLIKEKIVVTAYLKPTAKEAEIDQLQKKLLLSDYVKNSVFISKEQAAKEHEKELGENFLKYLGYNPLQNSIDIYLKSDYLFGDVVEEIMQPISKLDYVSDVKYDRPLIDLVNSNIQKIGTYLLIATGVLTFFIIIIINSTIRLGTYSDRFVINTMQMVGATKRFIRRPFILKKIKYSFIGVFMAITLLMGTIIMVHDQLPELKLMDSPNKIAMVSGGMILFSFFITWFSTSFATRRFLGLRSDSIY